MTKLPHIENIGINFKRFDSLQIDNLGLFNLIVGDNNVGKTSVLEALLISDDINQFLNYLIYVLYNFRNFSNLKETFIDQYLNKGRNELGFSYQTYSKENFSASLILNHSNHNINPKWKFSGQKNGFLPYKNESFVQFPFNSSVNIPIPYIPFKASYAHNFADYFSKEIQQSDSKMDRLIEDMKAIIPLITYIDINTSTSEDPILIIRQKGVDSKMPLGTFGDGVIKLFRILIEMQIHSGSRLMIDEVDTGIHYSRMKIFWKTLIRAARVNEVQLFATTHNAECIKYYNEALKEEHEELQKQSRIVRLVEMKDARIKAYTYEINEFAHSIENNNELR